MHDELGDLLLAGIAAAIVVLERFILWKLHITTRELHEEIFRRRERRLRRKYGRYLRKNREPPS